MTEPAVLNAVHDVEQEFSTSDDQTQPTSEILNVLNQLNNQHNVKPEPLDSGLPPAPPPTELEALTAELKQRPHNPEGWKRLVELAEQSGEIDKIRAAYDALLLQYPNTSSAQIAYISHFLNDPNTFGEAEELFKKFLRSSPAVELWKFYLIYVRRVNAGPATATRDTVRKSYEFALSHVGQDKDSGEIWRDHIQFLKAGEAHTTWEEQQKMDALRKVYHRAVQIPLDNVEALWQELEAFETGLNRITAKKFMADLSPAHMQARTTLRQLVNHLATLFPPPQVNIQTGRNEIYLPPLPTFNASERTLVGKWKAYLKWEESNPLEIEEKDKAVLIARLQNVYKKAVIRMRYYTEIWFMAYTWTNSVGKHDEAMSILRAGMEANPRSFLLTFTYAEVQETKKEFADVHATYEKFLNILRSDLEALEARDKAASPNSSFNNNNNNGGGGHANGLDATQNTTPTTAAPPFSVPGLSGGGSGTEGGSANSSFNTQASDEKMPKSSELQERRTEFGLAYIMYMRFGRRAEGVKSSRKVFGMVRKDRWAPWETYEAAALMEYHCSEDKSVASRIFEKGLDLFGDEIDYVLRYLGFLISINDENNARALFERVITTFAPERARPLWERWARYEYQYGDLEAALNLEKRISEVYPSDPPIKRFAQRHIYLGTDSIASRDLGFAMARRAGASHNHQALGRTETQQSLLSTGTSTTPGGPNPHKRPSSPDYRKGAAGGPGGGGGEYGQGHKRQRPMTPVRGDRERDGPGGGPAGGGPGGRWDGGGPPRRRFTPPPPPPVWERERDRPVPPPRSSDRDRERERERDREREREREKEREKEDKPKIPPIPQVLSWFIGELPAAPSFDGPVFRTEDLMNLFRNAVIPSSTRAKSPPPRSGGRPPPDYGPYQGPGGGGRPGRRY